MSKGSKRRSLARLLLNSALQRVRDSQRNPHDEDEEVKPLSAQEMKAYIDLLKYADVSDHFDDSEAKLHDLRDALRKRQAEREVDGPESAAS